jgi:ABC-type Zn uptake system ZnuABC Zn-binding protein ZnuA
VLFIPKENPVLTILLILQFYTKLEEKQKALEEEKNQAETRKKVRTYFVSYHGPFEYFGP